MELLEYLKNNLEFLASPLGIFFVICTLVGIAIAVFSYPKHYVKEYFIYAIVAFFAVVTYYFCDLNGSGWKYVILHPGTYFQYITYGICYTPFFAIFYWISVGIVKIMCKEKKNSVVKRIILISILGLFAILFASLCCKIAVLLVWVIACLIDNWRMAFM